MFIRDILNDAIWTTGHDNNRGIIISRFNPTSVIYDFDVRDLRIDISRYLQSLCIRAKVLYAIEDIIQNTYTKQYSITASYMETVDLYTNILQHNILSTAFIGYRLESKDDFLQVIKSNITNTYIEDYCMNEIKPSICVEDI